MRERDFMMATERMLECHGGAWTWSVQKRGNDERTRVW